MALLISVPIILSGCVEVPEDVRSRAEAIRTESEAPNGDLRYIGLDEARAELENAFGDIRTPFVMDNGGSYHVPEKLYDISFETYKGRTDYDSALRSLLGEYDPSKQKVDSDLLGEGMVYDDPEKSVYAAFSEGGFCSFYKDELYSRAMYESVIRDIFLVDTDDGSKEFEFNGRLTNVKEMTDKATAWLSDFDRINADGFSYVPSHVFWLENDGKDYLSIIFDRYYEGVKLSSCDNSQIPGPPGQHYTMTRNFNAAVYIDSSGEVSAFTTGSNLVCCTDKKEIDRIISPSSAFEILEKEFSTRLDLELVSVQLKYLLTYDYFCETESDVFVDAGVPNSARPVWEFFIKPGYPDMSDNRVTTVSDFYYINVDALTGEIDFELGEFGSRLIGF